MLTFKQPDGTVLVADGEVDLLTLEDYLEKYDQDDNPDDDEQQPIEPPKDDDSPKGRLIFDLETEPRKWKYSPVRAPQSQLAATMPWVEYRGDRYLHAKLTADPIHTQYNSWRVETSGGVDRSFLSAGKTFKFETRVVFPTTQKFGTGNLGWYTFTQLHDSSLSDGRSVSPCLSFSALPNGAIGVSRRWGIDKPGDKHKVEKKRVQNAYKPGEPFLLECECEYLGPVTVRVDGDVVYKGDRMGFEMASPQNCYPKQGIYNSMPVGVRAAEQRKYREQGISLEVMIGGTKFYAL